MLANPAGRVEGEAEKTHPAFDRKPQRGRLSQRYGPGPGRIQDLDRGARPPCHPGLTGVARESMWGDQPSAPL